MNAALLDVAVAEARAGLAEGGIPIGAALFSADGTLLGRGHNRRVQDDDPSMHAETSAFRNAGRQRDYRKTIMVTTLSPCWYCSGLVRQFNIGAVLVGEARTFHGGHDWLAENGVEVTVMDDERCVGLMTDFIAARPELWNEDIGEPLVIPTIDLRNVDAQAVDEALQKAGFLLVTGHGVDDALRADVRTAARRFFALPVEVKQRYAVRIGGRGWLAPGVEANGNVEGGDNPPDLKESFAVGPDTPTGDAAVDEVWFPANVWPDEVPELRPAVERYLAAMTAVSRELLELCAGALGLPLDSLTALAAHPTWTFNINRYPPLTEVGEPAPGQFRIGPHTDFGTVTVLDREPGAGGLQVDVADSGWADAPYDPAAFTVNIGDLLEHWTGLRWRSGRHRVLPPQPDSPHEELVSLVFFFELDHDAVVTPLAPPIGRRADLAPVVSAPFLRERLDAISVG